jgi:hypothetical protein
MEGMLGMDEETAKYRLTRLAREFDSQTFVAAIEEHYGGEIWKIFFQRGYHSYVVEIENERLEGWLASENPTPDMIETVKLAVEELAT